MTPKIHQKNQRDLNAWEQQSVDFFSVNSNKVPIRNTLILTQILTLLSAYSAIPDLYAPLPSIKMVFQPFQIFSCSPNIGVGGVWVWLLTPPQMSQKVL